MSKVSVRELSQFFKTNDKAKQLLDALLKRERSRRVTDLRQFHQQLLDMGFVLTEDDIVDIFQALDRLSVGSFVEGGRRRPNRFEWMYKVKSVAASAADPDTHPKLERFPKQRQLDTVHQNVINSMANKIRALANTAALLPDDFFKSNLSTKLANEVSLPREQMERIKKLIEVCGADT